jgi:hypothetical protein
LELLSACLDPSRKYPTKSEELFVWSGMTPSEIDIPQEAVVNFHGEIVKAISRMMLRTITREFDIFI